LELINVFVVVVVVVVENVLNKYLKVQ